MPIINIQHTVTEDDFIRYTRLAQELGYSDLTAFLHREVDKALFALTLPPRQQFGLRPDAVRSDEDNPDAIDLTQGT